MPLADILRARLPGELPRRRRAGASASPQVEGKRADAAAIDPEEMLVAALYSSRMLAFLHVAPLARFAVEGYRDRAEGVINDRPGRRTVTRVTLHPAIDWADAARLAELHHEAHDGCFIAKSVKTEWWGRGRYLRQSKVVGGSI